MASHKRKRPCKAFVSFQSSRAIILLMVTGAAAVVAVALTDRNRFESNAAAKSKAASRKVDN